MTKFDVENFLKNQQPHTDADAANEAVNKFFDGVEKLRNECQISNVVLALNLNVTYPSGIGTATTHMILGSDSEAEVLAAYMYGSLRSERLETLNKLLAGKKK